MEEAELRVGVVAVAALEEGAVVEAAEVVAEAGDGKQVLRMIMAE